MRRHPEALRELLPRLTSPVRYRVREISRFYPNRGDTFLGRVYLDLDIEETSPNRRALRR